MRLSIGLLLRLGECLLVGGALAVSTYIQLNSTSTAAWVVVTCAALVAIGGVVDPAARAIATDLGQLSFQQRIQVEQPLMGLMEALDRQGALTFRDVGVTAFLVGRTRRHPFAGVQTRVARIRFRATPHPTVISWSKDKGLLGECWRTRSVATRDHSAYYAPYANMTWLQWQRVDKHIRQRLSIKDVRALAQFGYVEAHPMIDANGTYRGCLVVQVDVSRTADLKSDPVQALISTAAVSTACVAGGAP